MVRKWLLAGAVMLVALAVGCGKSPIDEAPRAKPEDIGTPGKWKDGATPHSGGQIYIIKDNVDGETRMWALSAKVPIAEGELVQYDASTKIFYDKGRVRTYTLDGVARHTVPSGPTQGGKAPPLKRRRVELDRETGHVLLYHYGAIEVKDYDNPKEKAYVVVP